CRPAGAMRQPLGSSVTPPPWGPGGAASTGAATRARPIRASIRVWAIMRQILSQDPSRRPGPLAVSSRLHALERTVYFKQFYLGCLAHASYLIGSEGEAAVVDPRRDVDEYLAEAQANGLRIRYVIETHLHADFVSGHRELAERTGAEVVFGKRAGAAFPHRPVGDGDELRLGAVVLRFLETPGHTPESVSILV